MLTEQELNLFKQLLKQENHDYWKDQETLKRLHQNCKYTIRRQTRQMANIENYHTFKRHKEPNRENTLFLIYRAEEMYQATFDVTKLFKFLAISIFDERKLQEIVDLRSIKKEHQVFVSKREQSINRMSVMVNRFLSQYKMFKGEFLFEGEHLKDYLLTQKARIEYC